MLREARADELEELIDAFWPLAADLTRSTYPTYADGSRPAPTFGRPYPGHTGRLGARCSSTFAMARTTA